MKQDVLDEFNEGLKALRETDVEIGHVWKLPDAYDNVRFAVTEIAEASAELAAIEVMVKFGDLVNTDINNQGKDYARNNVQAESNLAKELTDVGMMILKYFLAREKDDPFTAEKRLMLAGIFTLTEDGIVLIPYEVQDLVDRAKSLGVDFDAISTIGTLLTYSMMLTKTVPGLIYADAILAAALGLVVTHEVFKNSSFIENLKIKLARTRRKVMDKEMNLR